MVYAYVRLEGPTRTLCLTESQEEYEEALQCLSETPAIQTQGAKELERACEKEERDCDYTYGRSNQT